jgi:4-amino-4-deoxy-L-arabinose transferase-like glycosyltransferase
MVNRKLSYLLLTVIVLVFMVIGALYAVKTPPWQAPDEPAHYNYIAQVAAGGCCPVIETGDWDSDTLDQLKADQFPENADLSRIEYEDHQPPLYYLLLVPIYLASGGSLIALRLASVVLGIGGPLAAYFVVARLLPRQRILGLAAAAFIAFIPQRVAIMASVNNDSLAETMLGIILVVAITYLGNPGTTDPDSRQSPLTESSRPHAAALGGLLGIAFLTKMTIYLPAAVVVGLAILLRWRIERQSIRWLAQQIVWAAGLALIIGSLWWVRDAIVYGWPDIFGQGAHGTVVEGQMRTADRLADIGPGSYLREYLTTTYHSFWGQFGWMGVPMPDRVYLLVGVFMLIALLGVIIAFGVFHKQLALQPWQTSGEWILAAVILATIANFIGYNLTFVQYQGRYLYTMLIPLGGLVALGLWGLSMWLRALLLERKMPHQNRVERWLAWLPLAALAWMPLLTLWALFKYLIPNLG